MTFEEARKRDDYQFTLNEIAWLIEDIRNNCMKDMGENGDPYRGAAVLEIGYIDIEVNIYTYEQCGLIEKGKTPMISYFVCLKHGDDDDDWASYDDLDYSVNVDWKANDWFEQLERDMFKALNMCVESTRFNYDSPN